MSTRRIGALVRETVTLMCDSCGTSVDLPPGRLNEDWTIEYRRCEEGHVVETVPHIYVHEKDRTRPD